MILCKYNQGRYLKVEYNDNEDFRNINKEYFFICHIFAGNAILMINGEKIYISSGAVLFYPKNADIMLLTSYKLKARSISFSPDFINVNLTWDMIESEQYKIICKEFEFPEFEMFYMRNILYNGVLPLDTEFNKTISDILRKATYILREQPDGKWSCNTRDNLFDLFEISKHLFDTYMNGDFNEEKSLEMKVLDYIHLNLYEPITIDELCRKFHTNHTTLGSKFKALTGFSVIDYIIDKKILLSKYALRFTSMTIEEIAFKYAFLDSSHFSNTFKTRVGMSPLKYRKSTVEKRKNADITNMY